ncbi:MAG: GGDEF domain-containing protein [bacterium]
MKNLSLKTYENRLNWMIRLRFLMIIIITVISSLSLITGNNFGIDSRSVRFVFLINILFIIINFILLAYQLYITKRKHLTIDQSHFNYLSFIHVDFDIIYVISIIYITGGLDSRFLLLLTYNIITMSFLVPGFRTYIYSAIVLILLTLTSSHISVVGQSPYLKFSFTNPMPDMVYIFFIYIFSVYIAKYVSNRIYEKQKELNDLYEKAYKMSITDSLTGLYDQRYFRLAASDAIDIAEETNHQLAVVMIDLDNFKSFNDHNGHLIGSRALKEISDIIKGSFRKTDILAKYGGDEFVILMRDIDDEFIIPTLRRFAHNIRTHDFSPEHPDYNHITASMGVAVFPRNGSTVATLIDRADKALYRVKNTGKDRLMLYDNIKE